MRSLTSPLLLITFLALPGSLVCAQSTEPADKAAAEASGSATKQEVDQLRNEVAEQRQTIEQLKALVQQLVDAKTQSVSASSQTAESPQLLNATLVEGGKPAEKKDGGSPVTAGFNNEHFYIKSADGQFQIQPNGYFQTDYRAYNGDGAPSATFVIRRARFGFLGNFGKHYDFNVLLDAAASNGLSLRDLFINIKPRPEFQFQVGQFKEPFAQELMTAVTNIDFVERSLASLLYPAPASAFRSPGAQVRGDVNGGVVQYWVGAFNGKGILVNNTTNQQEVIGRLRFYPWKKKKDNLFQGFAFGGAIGYGRSRGLSNETSFGGAIPNNAFAFFPSFRINGPIERYNGEFTWVHGPWAVRGEYDELLQKREGVGSEQSGGVGFFDLPGVRARAGYLQGTYLLTGETRPENGVPKVKHSFLAEDGGRGLGAFEVAFRYDQIRARAPGISFASQFAPQSVPTFDDNTDGFTFGLNWYPNYWVRYQFNVGVDRLKAPSVTGALPQNYFTVLQRLQFRF